MMKERILIQAWGVYNCNGEKYIEYTHFIYIKNILERYNEIHLVSPVNDISLEQAKNLYKIPNNVLIFELPSFSNYISAYRNFFSYLKLYNRIKNIRYDLVYSRFPSPFGWLQKIYFKGKRVVHYVGDPIDTLMSNPDVNFFVKLIKSLVFLPEYYFFIWSCYGNNVISYSNGHHISKKLRKFGLDVKPMISSTLTEKDFFEKKGLINNNHVYKLIYVGYLRKAKGVDILINAFEILEKKYPEKFSLTIIGTGEEETRLKEKCISKGLNIDFLGHIDDREKLNNILRKHDLFCFASLSEGSPRVILEAIANGLNVVTTPVGSLPFIFDNDIDLLYFEYNRCDELAKKIYMLSNDHDLQVKLRTNSFNKVKKFKIKDFIGEIFDA